MLEWSRHAYRSACDGRTDGEGREELSYDYVGRLSKMMQQTTQLAPAVVAVRRQKKKKKKNLSLQRPSAGVKFLNPIAGHYGKKCLFCVPFSICFAFAILALHLAF